MPRAPQKINSFVILDFETSGLDKKDGMHAKRCSATEVAAIGIDGVNFTQIVKYDNLIKPYDPSHEWQPEAARLTGITKELCIKDGVPLKQVVTDLCQVFTETNLHGSKMARPICVAHNWPYDRGYLMDIFERQGVDLSKFVSGAKDNSGRFIPDGLDSIVLAKMLWGDVTETDTKFNLAACLQKANIDMSDGHRALNDVIPLTDFLIYIITRLRSGSSEVTVSSGNVSIHRQGFEW